ncbi:unnamed protein product [Auanema sp. JU1783]|nr:unnamed protein product [Auanema sp. JU1783]
MSTSPRRVSRQSSIESDRSSTGLSRLLFNKRSVKRKNSDDKSIKSDSRSTSPAAGSSNDRNASSSSSSNPISTTKRLANFATRSFRRSQFRIFKYHKFMGTSKTSKNQLQLPRLTVRHPSIDGTTMAIDGDEVVMSERIVGPSDDVSVEFLAIRSNQRRWTDTESGHLRDSRDSSGFDGSHDQLDDMLPQAMTAPVSPSVPLSASSSQSDGWKYSSQKILWKLRPRYIGGFSHNSSTSSSTDSAWKSLDSSTWRHSLDDKEIILRGLQMETLSDVERSALQSVAQQRLAKLLPGVSLSKSKDPLSVLRQKRQKLIKTSRTLTVGDVSRRPSGSSADGEEKRLFGVSLIDCMQNERRLDLESRCRSLDDSAVSLAVPRSNRTPSCVGPISVVRSEPEFIHVIDHSRRWLYPSTQDLYPSTNPSSPSPLVGSAPPTCSLPPISTLSIQNNYVSTSQHLLAEIIPSHPTPAVQNGRFMKKHRPSSASLSYSLDGNVDEIDPHAIRVPRVVENCTQYLMAYGLTSVGLFRVAGNQKRCRQLRSALEKVGGGIAINDEMVENTTTHDVATLLKEYFRDLPQSLLPNDHYQAYLASSRLSLEERIECIRLLIALMDATSVDTLFVLLKFLHVVALHSTDLESEDGETINGNKMDAKNLATIFAPCILRPDHDKLQLNLAENDMQVTVMETMITHVEDIFRIPKELQCKLYNRLRETEPSRLDRVLDNLAKAEGGEQPLSSPFPATVEEDIPLESTHPNGKTKVCSQRSGSWPFSLRSPKAQRFFPNEDSVETEENSTTTAASADKSPNAASSISSNSNPPITKDGLSTAPVCSANTSNAGRSPSREREFLRSAARQGAAAARRRLRNVVRAFRFSSVARSTPNMTSNYT